MPFTPAHIAAVLPVAEPLRRRAPHALTALVIGSMAPDIPYYLPIPYDRAESHALHNAWGWTALLSLVVWVLWTSLLAPPVRDLSPGWVRARRGPVPRRLRLLDLPVAYAASVAGILTHLLWDSFTHSDGWFVRHHGSLSIRYGSWPLYQDLQLASSPVGCIIVAAYAVVFLLTREPRTVPAPRAAWGHVAIAALAVVAVLGAAWGAATSPNGDTSHDLGVYVATRCIGAVAAVAAVLAALWWWQRLQGRSRQAVGGEPASQSSTSAR